MAKYKDGGMLSMDKSKMANLPTESKMEKYPDPYSDLYLDMNNYMNRIDDQIEADAPKKRAGYKPAKLN